MKKLLLIIFILLSNNIFGQTYTPFNFTNGEWVVSYYCRNGFPISYSPYPVSEYVKYYCNGDTIINDTVYNKLYYIGYSIPPYSPAINISGYFGAIRNDSINKRVTIKDYYFLWEILYDFNLYIGDSFGDHYGPLSIVTSIDSVFYCGKYHKRFNYSNDLDSHGFLIEGIGSKYGLIPYRGWFPSTSTLLCYGERNSIYCDTCLTPSVTMINKNEINYFYFYPNPTSGKVHIQVPQQFGKLKTFELYNCIGQLQLVQFDNIADIDISSLPSGLYFIVLTNFNSERLTRKIIKE